MRSRHCLISLNPRQNNAEGGAAIDLRLILKRAAVFFDNARGNGQPQAGAGIFGGEKGIEEAFLDLRGNALAVSLTSRITTSVGLSARRFSSNRARRVMRPFRSMLSAALRTR